MLHQLAGNSLKNMCKAQPELHILMKSNGEGVSVGKTEMQIFQLSMAEEPSPLPMHTLPPCLFKLFSPLSAHILCILPSFYLFRALNFTCVYFIYKLLSLKITKSPQSNFFHSFPYTTLHSICISSHAGGLVASGRAYQLRVPCLSPSTCCPLFVGNTAEWPKITHMLP